MQDMHKFANRWKCCAGDYVRLNGKPSGCLGMNDDSHQHHGNSGVLGCGTLGIFTETDYYPVNIINDFKYWHFKTTKGAV